MQRKRHIGFSFRSKFIAVVKNQISQMRFYSVSLKQMLYSTTISIHIGKIMEYYIRQL
jgi:hypothetical protein